jgi:hypothetical protein
MSEYIEIGGQLVPVPPDLREAPDYRAAVAAWHKAELEARNLPHVLMPAPVFDHPVENFTGPQFVKGGHRGPGVFDADAPVEVPADVFAQGEAAARQWVADQRAAAAKADLLALRQREGSA